MSKYFEIRWHGRGGQGTVTGAKSLAEAVQGTGKHRAERTQTMTMKRFIDDPDDLVSELLSGFALTASTILGQ